MSRAVEIIAKNYVDLRDRMGLERMREHRNKLLQSYRTIAAQGSFNVESIERSLHEDLDALNEALSRVQ
jgi:uncharacterized protein YutE (UPF0331/DUF86 family)